MPLAMDAGAVHFPLAFSLLIQISTSGLRSLVPPNQAATKPSGVSAIVAACDSGNGILAAMNSSATIPDFQRGCARAMHPANKNPVVSNTLFRFKDLIYAIFFIMLLCMAEVEVQGDIDRPAWFFFVIVKNILATQGSGGFIALCL